MGEEADSQNQPSPAWRHWGCGDRLGALSAPLLPGLTPLSPHPRPQGGGVSENSCCLLPTLGPSWQSAEALAWGGAPSVFPSPQSPGQGQRRGRTAASTLPCPLPDDKSFRVLPQVPSPFLLKDQSQPKGPPDPRPLVVEMKRVSWGGPAPSHSGSWFRSTSTQRPAPTSLPLPGPSASEGPALTPLLALLSYSFGGPGLGRHHHPGIGESAHFSTHRAECESVLPLTAV